MNKVKAVAQVLTVVDALLWIKAFTAPGGLLNDANIYGAAAIVVGFVTIAVWKYHTILMRRRIGKRKG